MVRTSRLVKNFFLALVCCITEAQRYDIRSLEAVSSVLKSGLSYQLIYLCELQQQLREISTISHTADDIVHPPKWSPNKVHLQEFVKLYCQRSISEKVNHV